METKASFRKQIKSVLRDDNAELLQTFLESKDYKDLVINYRLQINHKTLMVLAAEQGRLEIVRLLLTVLGVNDTWRDDVTPLMLAAENNHLELVKLLLEKGADVRAMDSEGLSAIHFACRKGHEEIVKLLYQHGASIFNEGEAVAHETFGEVFAMDRTNIIYAIVNNENDKEQIHRELIYSAIVCNNVEFVEVVLDLGVSIETELLPVPPVPLDNRTTPLLLALRKTKPMVEMVKMLLDRGANVMAIEPIDKCTALHLAAYKNEIDIMRLLLEYGADINARDDMKSTPLIKAIKNAKKEATKFLLSKGADVNIQEFEWIPHFLLCYHRDVIVVKGIPRLRNNTQLEVVKIVVKHIVILQSQGLFVCEGNLKAIRNDATLNEFQSRCKNEIVKIKAEKETSDSCFSLYDVLKGKRASLLAIYYRNTKTADYLMSDKFRKDFPIYSETIWENFDKREMRKFLQARVRNFFANLSTRKEDKLPRLPVLCTSEIFSYLDNKDLVNLREAYY